MKKLLALALALVLTLSLSVTAFAAEGDKTIGTSGSDYTEVKYEVKPTYTVTIPANVTLGETGTVKIADASVAKGKKVVVKIDATSGTDNAFKVKTTEGAELTYTITDGASKIFAVKDTVLEAAPSDTTKGNGSIVLTFTTPENVIYAGTYTGTVTFAVSVEAV